MVFLWKKTTCIWHELFNPLSANPTKWSKTLKKFVGKLNHFFPKFPFYAPWKHQKTKAFLVFLGKGQGLGYEMGTQQRNGFKQWNITTMNTLPLFCFLSKTFKHIQKFLCVDITTFGIFSIFHFLIQYLQSKFQHFQITIKLLLRLS